MKPRSRVTPPLLIVLALLAAACGEGPTAPAPPAPITELPRALTLAERTVVDATGSFAFDLARELAGEDPGKNLFISPLSASLALAMTMNGADGTTVQGMRTALRLEGLSEAEINTAFQTLLELLDGLDPSVGLAIANSIWFSQGTPPLPDFLQRVRTHYGAEVAEVDFGNPATLGRVNGWVSTQTRGAIPKIMDDLPGNLVMLLLNAIHFQGDWTTPFDPRQTETRPFTRGDGSTVSVPLMQRRGTLRGAFRGGASMVELPYGGGAFTFVALLPPEEGSPEEMLAGLTPAGWNDWLSALQEEEGVVYLPRFSLEWEKRLNGVLGAMGMEEALTPGADFSRLVPGGGVWIDEVKQKSFVEVDEEGTTAAAVTSVSVVDSAPPEFRLDRPFLFAIRERLSGTLLFVGILNDPEE